MNCAFHLYQKCQAIQNELDKKFLFIKGTVGSRMVVKRTLYFSYTTDRFVRITRCCIEVQGSIRHSLSKEGISKTSNILSKLRLFLQSWFPFPFPAFELSVSFEPTKATTQQINKW